MDLREQSFIHSAATGTLSADNVPPAAHDDHVLAPLGQLLARSANDDKVGKMKKILWQTGLAQYAQQIYAYSHLQLTLKNAQGLCQAKQRIMFLEEKNRLMAEKIKSLELKIELLCAESLEQLLQPEPTNNEMALNLDELIDLYAMTGEQDDAK